MSEPIEIRRAGPDDLDMIVGHNRAIAQETEDLVLDEAVVRRGCRAALDDPRRAFYLVAEREGRPLGQLMITPEWSDWRDGAFWWIQSVYVRPEARRAGVFRALFAKVSEEARRRDDVCGLRLYVDRANRRAKAVYSALGMAPAHYDLYEIDFVLGDESAPQRAGMKPAPTTKA
jgi:GNAT superfamily N-acetyltransferase